MVSLRRNFAFALLFCAARISLAQPNIAPPAPPVIQAPLPKTPLIEPAARALVEAVAARYQAMNAYSDAMTLTGFAGAFEAKIAWQQPNRARVEAKIGGKNSFGLNDGKVLRAINPAHSGYYIKRTAEPDRIFDAFQEADIGAPGYMLIHPGGRDRGGIMADFLRDGLTKLEMGLPEDFEGAPMQVVRAWFAFDDGHDSVTTMLIGNNDGVLHQLTQSYTGMGNVVETHRDIVINPVLPPETWQWTPPDGLKPISYFPTLEPERFKPIFAPGQKLPDFKALDLNGQTVSLAALKGKAVMLFFFSIRNAGEIEPLMELQTQFGPEKLAIVGVSMDGRRERVAEWAKAQKATFPIVFDEAGPKNPTATTYGVRSWSTMLLIDAQGVLQGVFGSPYEVGFEEKLKAITP